MRKLRFFLVSMFAFLVMFFAFHSSSSAKPEYSKKEKVGCTVCHTKAGSKELNDVGKCYQQKHDLAQCKK